MIKTFELYLKSLQRRLLVGNHTENTFRLDLENLFQVIDQKLILTNEPKRAEFGAPDFFVARPINNCILTVGYIETKVPGSNLDLIEETKQIQRYLYSIDNFILTDYLEFRWYVSGQKRMTGRLGSVTGKNLKKYSEIEAGQAFTTIKSFCEHYPSSISNSEELARRMARTTHIIRDIVENSFNSRCPSNILCDLYKAFSETLVPLLTYHEFADIFAQTLAYGLFTARVYDSSGTFNRLQAASLIPRTTPFLRKLLAMITGPDLNEEPYARFVDDLAQLMSLADINSVINSLGKSTYKDDPIVHFYETFLTAYDPALRIERGVFYTPKPVVDFIVKSVDSILESTFELEDGLSNTSIIDSSTKGNQIALSTHLPRVMVLDPACGTGTFLYCIIEYIRQRFMDRNDAGKWPSYVDEYLVPMLVGFELMVSPYAISHLKLHMQLSAYDLPEKDRESWGCSLSTERIQIYLTNSLEEGIQRSRILLGSYISDEANIAANIKNTLPIMVVLGNPPYYANSLNNGKWIKRILRDYYELDGQPLKERNSKWLQDDYVKFIRFGQWKIEQTGAGVVAFVTNHGYLENPTFRGMRQQLLKTFDEIYILDLHGSSLRKECNPDGGSDENVFDIRPGVAISIFIKSHKPRHSKRVFYKDLWGTRESKYSWLLNHDINTTPWEPLEPKSPFYLLTPQDNDLEQEYFKFWSIKDSFPLNGVGITTARDKVSISCDKKYLLEKAADFCNEKYSDTEVCTRLSIPKKKGWNVSKARKTLQTERNLEQFIKPILYRPFDQRFIFYHDSIVWRTAKKVMLHMAYDNLALISARSNKSPNPDHFFCTRTFIEAKCGESTTQSSIFPLYTYEHHELFNLKTKKPNLSPKFILDVSKSVGLNFTSLGSGDLINDYGPEDIFHYLYAIFHSQQYRHRYAKFLKIDFPRIPVTTSLNLFQQLVVKGARLTKVHLQEVVIPLHINFPVPGTNTVEVTYPKYFPPDYKDPRTGERIKTGRIYINSSCHSNDSGQYFDNISPEVWEFRIGGYQVCKKWLKERRRNALNNRELTLFCNIITSISATKQICMEIDSIIPSWPLP